MTRPVSLECFDEAPEGEVRRDVSSVQLEEARLQAYESGFTAGWDDAINAQDEEIARLRADLGQSLRELSLTYAEARGHIQHALEPLLVEMVAKVLPKMAQEALGHLVLEALRPETERLLDVPVRLRAHPENQRTVEEIVIPRADFPLVFEAEPSLSRGQVRLIAGPREVDIDLDRAIAEIGAAVTDFFQADEPQEAAHD
ncbi:flagellar biosynthesis protein [Defluviimonas sp. WL0075]|uniref:Flagellar biosynthesis protein n=1 Tax=Albidovulum sediminicola TaxID=2984331 RepID=A0ABT2YW93_9RHOB|nr:flagellar biosynthesis protein [Defluviimonas sp. WL0075]MCV2863138.1 flagellar biosynthesis protein [Defluviimonas sp. WL0075]